MSNKKYFPTFSLLLITLILSISSQLVYAKNSTITIQIELPEVEASPYFRSYVAVWLETLERQPVATLALWYQTKPSKNGEGDGGKWLKDIRQWWRKVGNKAGAEIDGVTGATRHFGKHQVIWNGLDNHSKLVPNGKYYLNMEAVREEGGREFIRQKITLGENSEHQVQGKNELGKVQITIVKQY